MNSLPALRRSVPLGTPSHSRSQKYTPRVGVRIPYGGTVKKRKKYIFVIKAYIFRHQKVKNSFTRKLYIIYILNIYYI